MKTNDAQVGKPTIKYKQTKAFIEANFATEGMEAETTDTHEIGYYNGTAWKWTDYTGGAALTVEEVDGTPTVANVSKIKVTNGSLTDNTGGVVTLDFGSAATDGAAIHDNTADEISAITEKTTPVSADMLIIEDSEASNVKKMVQIGNLPSGAGDMLWAVIQASQLVNEVMGFPAEVPHDTDLVTGNLWWDSVATPTTAATFVDVAGEAGITETWKHAIKCVADGSGDGFYQRYTYADQPRIKAGRKLSAIAAVWVGTNGRTVTMKLKTSNPTEVSATATAQAWTIIKCENLALDGSYVDLQFTVDGADTFYVVPLGVNIGEKAFPLKPRGSRYVETAYSAVVNNVDPGGADWTDADFTSVTSNLANKLYVRVAYNNSTTVFKRPQIRRNGSSDTIGQAGPYVQLTTTGNTINTLNTIVCDDAQIIEWKTNAAASDTEGVTISIQGYWEWE